MTASATKPYNQRPQLTLYECRVRQTSAPAGYSMTDSSFHDVGSSGTQSLYYTNNATSTVQPIARTEYVYGSSAWGDQLTSYNGQSISYDAMGNPTSYLGATMTWQGKQLATATKNGNNYGYFYDENGLRLRKTTNGVATNYYYNGSVLIGMTQGATTQRFSYDSSGNVLSVNYNGTEYYYLRNGQGDIVKLIDNAGSTVVEYKYDTWGKQLSCTGTLATTLGTNQPFRYRGYVYDTETGWYYLQSRYYNPEVGRFLSADVYLSTGQGVLGNNVYAYCLNNPSNMADPGGGKAILTCNILLGNECGIVYGGGAISIHFTGNTVIISATIAVSGSGIYDESFVESSLKKFYEGNYTNNGVNYNVVLDLTFVSYDANEDYGPTLAWTPGVVEIMILEESGVSYASGYPLTQAWKHDKSGSIVAYSMFETAGDKTDFDWTIAHEFTHCMGIGDHTADEDMLFGGRSSIMNTRGCGMTNDVYQLIFAAFRENTLKGW